MQRIRRAYSIMHTFAISLLHSFSSFYFFYILNNILAGHIYIHRAPLGKRVNHTHYIRYNIIAICI